jgi:hypothetical protein
MICSEKDCFKKVDDLEFQQKKADGTYHEMALKCWDCRGDAGRKTLKNFNKRRKQNGKKNLEI